MRWWGLPPAVIRMKTRIAENTLRDEHANCEHGLQRGPDGVLAVPVPRGLAAILQRIGSRDDDDDVPPTGRSH